jgi:low affinity Fe/Cu permease
MQALLGLSTRIEHHACLMGFVGRQSARKSRLSKPSVAAPATEAQMSLSRRFTDFAEDVAHATGKPITFALCVIVVLLWAVTGLIFQFSDARQLVINTGTTIVTFLMVFLIQNTQNRDGVAIQTKLDELIRASAAQNKYIGIEHLTEEELDELWKHREERARKLKGAKQVAKAADEATGGLRPFKPSQHWSRVVEAGLATA